MITKKKSVGIQLLGRNTKRELFAILQIRAKWNSEKNGPESYPGACQVTVHGKLEESEDFKQALWREIAEELGEEFVPIIRTLAENKQLIELINSDTFDKKIITYGTIVGEDICKKLLKKQKNELFGGFRIIKRNEIDKIADLLTFDKTIGVADENIIAMFPDEKEAVRLAFEKFG